MSNNTYFSGFPLEWVTIHQNTWGSVVFSASSKDIQSSNSFCNIKKLFELYAVLKRIHYKVYESADNLRYLVVFLT